MCEDILRQRSPFPRYQHFKMFSLKSCVKIIWSTTIAMVPFDVEYEPPKKLQLAFLHYLSSIPRYYILKCLNMKIYDQVTSNNTRNGPIRSRISTSTKCLSIFLLLSQLCRYSYFKRFHLENVDQGHALPHSQWCHSMTKKYALI